MTITHDHLLLVAKIIPCLTLAYIIFKVRHAIKLNANVTKNILIVAVTFAAGTIVLADWMHETPEQREVRVEREAIEEEQEKIVEQKEKQEEREKFEDKLPGKWGNLYQAMQKTGDDDMRIALIESFIIHYGTNIEELLPMEGLELVLREMWNNGPKEQVRAALTPYFIPFRDESLKTEILAKNEEN